MDSWYSGNPITQLAEENGIKTLPTDYDNHWIYQADGSELSEAEYEALEEYGSLFQAYVTEANNELDEDISIQMLLDSILAEEAVSATEKRMILYLLNSIIEHEYAADLNQLSLFSLEMGLEFGGGDVIFPGGYHQIVEVLADGLDIRLNEVVEQVTYGDDGVVVTTNQGRFEGDRAVITLPVGVLKRGQVQFSPALPREKQDTIQTLQMGLLDKVYLRFPHIFWPKEPELIGYISSREGEWSEWLNIAHYIDVPILLAFNAATFARTTETWSDEQIIEGAMTTLRTLFGSAIPDPAGWQITRWAADPYAFGSYSYLPPGTDEEAIAALAAPVASRLFFAGEATTSDYQATVHGAYLSGIRAAEEIGDI